MEKPGIACLKHDLTTYKRCGHCYEELEEKVKRLANENKRLLEVCTQWMDDHDKLKAKYEPEIFKEQ